ncbi:MAG: DUF3782 domain-containing protein [Cyanobacteria bacterium RI_101]|nr:DUF3782 domain-containing protein [Cyanobacteria bacterium RI_101]
MPDSDLKTLIQAELPQLLAEDPAVRDFILRTVSHYYADKQETESRFDRVLNELEGVLDELEQNRAEEAGKWEEYRIESQNFRADQARKWEENTRQINAILAELKRADRRYNSAIGAIGSRWGLYSEESFRSGLRAILEESFQVEVININDFDEEGEVFGRPDQVEIDIIVQNGSVIACEIKSSVSKADMYSFDRKVAFYQKRHRRPVNRKMVISPMPDQRALAVAEALGIEVYSYPESVESLEPTPP